ncbi:hypothetical protein AVEN_253381-1 [Araneus ventricosus]|uniref:Secreted protein n=1 Tax=Araneus ventricosus TaxID=182803 RepID=A0A4Y2VR69_ARAVE|nr:hypothetical protein AVEN_228309-1 [Araneus ventricosus]GBO27650.1 hypothetical protein AVEN_253381-1 [Araneus ventricosus]
MGHDVFICCFIMLKIGALVSLWQGVDFGAGEVQVQISIPLKVCHVWSLLHFKSYVMAKRTPAGVVRKFVGVCQLMCRLRHLVSVQNDEVRYKIVFVLLQNGKLI